MLFSELKTSINAILYERVASPFFGSLIVSWSLWNWKILYLTFFVSERFLKENKIDYIIANYNNPCNLVVYPLVSTVVLITIVPFASNGAYWLHLKFRQWKIDRKDDVEKKQRITIEKSIALRKEIREKENEFEKLLENKSSENKLLRAENNQLQNELKEVKEFQEKNKNQIDTEMGSLSDYEKFKKEKKAFKYFESIVESIGNGNKLPSDIGILTKEYYKLNDIIDETSADFFVLTPKGKVFYQNFFNEKYSQSEENKLPQEDLSIIKLYDKIKSRKAVTRFKEIAIHILKSNYLKKDDSAVDYFLEIGLIRPNKNTSQFESEASFKLTEEGEKLLNYIRFIEPDSEESDKIPKNN